ncbi:8b9d8e57-0d28-4237-8979-ec8f8d9eca14 [Sclerotinia trifoliorum]|uniref:8b9d8e57-0d28-4237-8979-ec8f8d9eca14 n=1 Tax=Sclerotinia trifoliorum TaxID=28548 RepID=A0A8H2ZTC0_9HELO|nr:8b9d8e57-0d28-4237-8979-ec8f8d9eca14 [Sclerotinia trifoliorum]
MAMDHEHMRNGKTLWHQILSSDWHVGHETLGGWVGEISNSLGAGRHGTNPELLAYVGTSDVRYTTLVIAAASAGYTIFVTSPATCPNAHHAVLDHLQPDNNYVGLYPTTCPNYSGCRATTSSLHGAISLRASY